MGTLKPGATYIYESPDGGKTTYAREAGTTERKLIGYSYDMQQELERVHKEQQWLAILKLSEKSPALQEAVEKCIMLYNLQATEDDKPILWHPV